MNAEDPPELSLPASLKGLVDAFIEDPAVPHRRIPAGVVSEAPTQAEAAQAVLRLAGRIPYSFPTGGAEALGESEAGRRLLDLPPAEKTLVAVYAFDKWSHEKAFTSPWERVFSDLFRSKLELDERQALSLLAAAKRLAQTGRPERIASVTGALKRHVEANGLKLPLRSAIDDLSGLMRSTHADSHLDGRRILKSLDEIVALGGSPGGTKGGATVPEFVVRDAWGRKVSEFLAALAPGTRNDVAGLLALAAEGGGNAKPSKAWLKRAKTALGAVDGETVGPLLLDIIALFNVEGRGAIPPMGQRDLALQSQETLRALLWLAAMAAARSAGRRLEALARTYLTWVGFDYNSLVLGNAAIHAFAMMPGIEGVGGLTRLRSHLKRPGEVKTIDRALAALAQTSGIAAGELEEIGLPEYGPESTATAKEIDETVKAQRLRIERLYLEDRSWPLPVWRERYVEQPLVADFTQRLIWSFEDGEQRRTGMPVEGGIAGAAGELLALDDATVRVKLWHPMHSETPHVLAWRRRLTELGVTQPFKQAHREIYVLTDAERETAVYSNRFAAHILSQKILRALTLERGWKSPLQGKWSGGGPTLKELPAQGLRFTLAVTPIEASANARWEFEQLSSGAVYFSRDLGRRVEQTIPLRDGTHIAFRGPAEEAIPLVDIDPVLFSEMMRDVDLFVGVAGIGNDPTWADRGAHDFIAYWQQQATGTLAETGKVRRSVLAELLPSLSIAPRLRLEERHLIVEGKLSTYRIHLGSANVQMVHNDQYLCIVPEKAKGGAQVYLPFEGDSTLSIVLSKAFMLADDDKIKDRSIRAQIDARR